MYIAVHCYSLLFIQHGVIVMSPQSNMVSVIRGPIRVTVVSHLTNCLFRASSCWTVSALGARLRPVGQAFRTCSEVIGVSLLSRTLATVAMVRVFLPKGSPLDFPCSHRIFHRFLCSEVLEDLFRLLFSLLSLRKQRPDSVIVALLVDTETNSSCVDRRSKGVAPA